MNIPPKPKLIVLFLLLSGTSLLCSCLTSKKMDKFVAEQYDNELPKQNKKKTPDINISSSIFFPSESISVTTQKTSHVLPLILYWQFDYRHTCTLNPAIAINNFSNVINLQVSKGLNQTLNGQKLELTVEQVPRTFAIVDKAHIIWIIYAFSWDKLFVQPDFMDLIVSYKVLQNGNPVKSGKIVIKNNESNKNIRWFQSWKSATSEYLARYNQDLTNLCKALVNKLNEEL